MALMTGIDLSFFKDEGFRKHSAFIVGEIGIIVWTAMRLMPVAEGLLYLIGMVTAYTGINIGAKALLGVQAAKDAKTNGGTN